ncbi:MAG: hypothetical protein N2379_00190 [Verrucomicrobiae bacterium]|nr:hypothetical protein [Verrucomicrobiae bacterium]
MSSRIVYRVSLGLNVVLAAAAVVLALPKRGLVPAARELSDVTPATTKKEAVLDQQTPASRSEVRSESERRRAIIDRLRAMGVPNDVLARVALADIEVAWEARFWDEARGADPFKMAALQLEFDMTKDAEMRAALGEAAFRQWDQARLLREAISGKVELTPAESDAIYGLMKKLQQRRLELEQARLKGEMDDAEINDAYEKAYAELHQQMRAILGEARYALSQGLDVDMDAARLQRELAKVPATQAQFQELLDIQRRLNDARAELDKQFEAEPGSPVYAQKLAELEDARRREYERVLGQEAFEALQKQHDGRYLKMRKYAEAWGLDDTELEHVYAAIRYYEKSVAEYIAGVRGLEAQGARVDWAEVNRNLEQFGEQMQRALEGQLGQETFLKLKRNGILPFAQ